MIGNSAQTDGVGVKKQKSLHPQTMRIRLRLEQWSKQGRKHWDLYRHLMDPYVLLDALRLVLRNRGVAGIDGQSCQEFRGGNGSSSHSYRRNSGTGHIDRDLSGGCTSRRRMEEEAFGDTEFERPNSATSIGVVDGAYL